MSNTRHANGRVPAALSATGQEIPPSPDVAEASLADIIGQTVALHLANVLGPMLQQVQAQPACVICVQGHKQAAKAHDVAVANAAQSAEEPPEVQLPPIMPAVTWMPLTAPGQPPQVLPVCYGHFQAGPTVRPTGLVLPDGRPVVAQA